MYHLAEIAKVFRQITVRSQ